jgi:hypothetical protein
MKHKRKVTKSNIFNRNENVFDDLLKNEYDIKIEL